MSSDVDNDWRRKYFDALARLESGEKQSKKMESVLRLLASRLCLAAQGHGERLDGELRGMSDLIRRQAEAVEIEARLEPLSRAIAALDETPKAGDPVRVSAAQQIASPESARTPNRSSVATVPAGGHEAVTKVIGAALERIKSLPELRHALGELRDKPATEISVIDLANSLKNLVDKVGEQRARLQREKFEVEALLTQMNSRLEEIATHLAGNVTASQEAQDSTQQLNRLVMDEVNLIGTTVLHAADLSSLRKQVAERLDAIQTHLQDFRMREVERSRGQIDRTEGLSARIAELERESRTLQEKLQEEQRSAAVDALTGIANRAAYDERIAEEFNRWRSTGASISLVAWDIDKFKAVNDAYGHKAGDKVLRVVAQHLAQHVRGTDFVARYGGEEFVMILPETPLDQATSVAEKIRAGIAAIGFHFRNQPVTVTASCGVTTFRPHDTTDTVFERADQALYRAKEQGRDCCVAM